MTLAATAVGCLDTSETSDDTDSEEVMAVSDEIVLDSADYLLLTQLEGLGPDGVRANYARAVGEMLNGCSASLIDDGIILTSRACRMAGNQVVAPATQTFEFGKYGPFAPNGSMSRGILDAVHRLVSLGVPTHVFGNGEVTLQKITRWSCTASQVTPGRDIEYYSCDPNLISWTSPDGTATQLSLLPGHLWGHFNVKPQVPGPVTSLRGYGVNRRCGDAAKSTLASRGIMWETSEDCPEFFPDGFGSCFDHSSDSNAGHEGGPLTVDATNEIFGINSGSWVAFLWDAGDHQSACESADFAHAENLGTYLGNDVFGVIGTDLDGGGANTGYAVSYGAHVGGYGGTQKTLSCPDQYLAAGVIGSSSSAGHLGNFGLICMPNVDSFQGDLTADVSTFRLDRAVVVTGGSVDTGFVVANRTDFNSYLNEVQTTTGSPLFQQRFMMCPPGQYLKSIRGYAGTYADQVRDIQCAPNRIGGLTSWHDVSSRSLGELTTQDDPSLELETTGCAGMFDFVTGLVIRSGWVTDGYRASCRSSIE